MSSTTPTATGTAPLKVRATAIGYFEHLRRRVGDVFLIPDDSYFSNKWMERVDPRSPEKVSTLPEALRQQHDEILASRLEGRPVDADEYLEHATTSEDDE